MRRETNWLLFGVGLLALAGCVSRQLSGPGPAAPDAESRAAMQTSIYTGRYDTVFAATVAVLQDLDWRLEAADKASGIIRGHTSRRFEPLGPEEQNATETRTQRRPARQNAAAQKWSRWKEAVIHTEPWGEGRTRQRIVLNLCGSLPATSHAETQGSGIFKAPKSVMIHDPPVEQTVEVLTPEPYRDLFERIEKAVRRRDAL